MPDIFEAIDNCDLEEVKEVLRQDPEQINSLNSAGHLPIFYAMDNNSDESKNAIIEFFFENIKDLSVIHKRGITLIQIITGSAASLKFYQSLLNKAIEKDVSILYVAYNGVTPFSYILDFAMDSKFYENLIKQLIDKKKLDVNFDRYGSPLILEVHHKASNNEVYSGILLHLINNGADLNLKNGFGETLLHRVVDNLPEEEKLFNYILTKDIDVNQQDKSGITVLHKCITLNKNNLIEPLINKGAILNKEDKEKLIDQMPEKAEMLIQKSNENNARKKLKKLFPGRSRETNKGRQQENSKGEISR